MFLALQAHTALPLLPLSLFADRNRVGSYATILFIGAGLKGSFHPLALFLQQVLQHEPLKTGVASLPFAARNILAAGGMSWLSTLTQGSSYAGHVMPALFGTSFGLFTLEAAGSNIDDVGFGHAFRLQYRYTFSDFQLRKDRRLDVQVEHTSPRFGGVYYLTPMYTN